MEANSPMRAKQLKAVGDPIRVDLLVCPHNSASGLYGLYDVLTSVGIGWEHFVTGEPELPRFAVRIVGQTKEPFRCSSGIDIVPDASVDDASDTDIIVVTGLNASASEPLGNQYPILTEWLRFMHGHDTRITSACTGAILLAESGVLDGVEATTHWAFKDLFRVHYPNVRLRLERNLCWSDRNRGVVTSGGTTAWQELALFLITQHLSIEQAVRAAKFWLLPDHGALQAPYVSMPIGIPHRDAVILDCQTWISDNYAVGKPVSEMSRRSFLKSATFSRRFKLATGYSPMDYVHTVRVEQAKQLLEQSTLAIDEIGRDVGYEDIASFRRLFKRITGLNPAAHRRMFGFGRFEKYIERT